MTNSVEQIEIPLSKKKLIIMLIGSIGFVAVGLWFVIKPPAINNSFFGNSTVILLSGIASILFFGLCAVFMAPKISDKKPGLIIDSIGITDNSSGVSAGQIFWNDIENISVIELHRQKLIMLHLINPQEYIDKQTSGFKRKVMNMNLNMYETPCIISSNTLQINFDELLSILYTRLEESRE